MHKSIKTSLYLIIGFVISTTIFILEFTSITSFGKFVNGFSPCVQDPVAMSSLPCFIKYDIYLILITIFLALLFLVVILVIKYKIKKTLIILGILISGLCTTLFTWLWSQVAFLPYTSEGKALDSHLGHIYSDNEPLFWGILACVSFAVLILLVSSLFKKYQRYIYITGGIILITVCILTQMKHIMLATRSSGEYSVVQHTQENRTIPTAFRTPTPDGPPHIVGAEIERISIPNCEGCYADIIKKMDGVSDAEIIKINNQLTLGVFGNEDIRYKHFNLNKNIKNITVLNSKVIYANKDVIGFVSSLDASTEDLPVQRSMNSYGYIDINSKNLVGTDIFSNRYDENKALEYFYPNGKSSFDKYIKDNDTQDNHPDYINGTCYGDKHFPEDFYPSLHPNTKEVVFSAIFSDSMITYDCSPGLEIAIPIADILREVPQYVPKDSVLWKFADK